MILRCEDPSFRWAASIKSIYSTKPMTTLMFRNTVIETISHNGQICFTSTELAKALDYSSVKSVTNLYNQNRDEFTEGMSLVIDSVTNGINNSLRKIGLRIFSLHGAHLIAMLANTPIAKEFHKWVLDKKQRSHNTNPSRRTVQQ
ncbi:BRO-N domain-containing protein [Symbiopectobacterium sp. RP]